MKKTIRVLIEAEYEIDTDTYPESQTAMEMALTDLLNDPGAFLETANVFEVTQAEFLEASANSVLHKMPEGVRAQ